MDGGFEDLNCILGIIKRFNWRVGLKYWDSWRKECFEDNFEEEGVSSRKVEVIDCVLSVDSYRYVLSKCEFYAIG